MLWHATHLLLIFVLSLGLLRAEERVEMSTALHAALLLEDSVTALSIAKALLAMRKIASSADAAAVIRAYGYQGSRSAYEAFLEIGDSTSFGESSELLEELAWVEIFAAERSSVEQQRVCAVIAAAASGLLRAEPILLRGLHARHATVRAASVQGCCHLRTSALFSEICSLSAKERDPLVLREVVNALIYFNDRSAIPHLFRLCKDPALPEWLHHAVWEAITKLQGGEDPALIERLAHSSIGIEREYACRLTFAYGSQGCYRYLVPLLNDLQPIVRILAFQSLAHWQEADSEHKAFLHARALESLREPHPGVAAAAAYFLLLGGDSAGVDYLLEQSERRLSGSSQRLGGFSYAIAAITAAGEGSLPIAERLLNCSSPRGQPAESSRGCSSLLRGSSSASGALLPYEWLPLASHLLQWRRQPAVNWLGKHFSELLCLRNHYWKEEFWGFFPYLTVVEASAATLSEESILNDFSLRIRGVALLAAVGAPEALDAAKSFLHERFFGVAASALTLLLLERESSTLPLFHELMDSSVPALRMQAALLLAAWEKSYEAVERLIEGYEEASFQDKIRILEAIGSSQRKESIPFISGLLVWNSHPTHRLVAAGALFQLIRG